MAVSNFFVINVVTPLRVGSIEIALDGVPLAGLNAITQNDLNLILTTSVPGYSCVAPIPASNYFKDEAVLAPSLPFQFNTEFISGKFITVKACIFVDSSTGFNIDKAGSHPISGFANDLSVGPTAPSSLVNNGGVAITNISGDDTITLNSASFFSVIWTWQFLNTLTSSSIGAVGFTASIG